MSRDYEVGKGKPPKHTRFGIGNQAAKGRGKAKKRPPTMKQLLDEVLTDRYTVKRGNDVVTMVGADLLKQRFKHWMTQGSPRDLAALLTFMTKHGAGSVADEPESVTVTYEVAKDSTVDLPPDDLLENGK